MKKYIITGASSDISIAFLKRLEETGEPSVIACQYNKHKEQLEELKGRFNNIDLKLYSCNLKKEKECAELMELIKEDIGTPTHILHISAQEFDYMKIKDFEWEKVVNGLTIQVNTFAQLMKAFLPNMVKQKYGKVAVMLTAYTIGVPPKFMSDYIITKYALLGLMKSVANEYAGKGITINGLSPNMIETKFLNKMDSRFIEINGKNSAMKRNVELKEIIDCIVFLLSDASNYINGVNLNISGGDRM